MSFSILTDTCCNLSQELVDRYGLSLVPLRYSLDGVECPSFLTSPDPAYIDGLYDKLRTGSVVTTSLVSPLEAEQKARAILETGNDLLYIGFSSALSGTFNAVSNVLAQLSAEYPDRKAYAVDSLCASAGEGLLVTYVANMRDAGSSIEECRDWAQNHRLNICHRFTVTDLMYLNRGGRCSTASAIFGTALNIKPILDVNAQGELKVIQKVRGRRKSLSTMADDFGESAAVMPPDKQIVYISHAGSKDDALVLADMLVERYHIAEPQVTYIDPVIGAHSGPGTVALFYFDCPSHR